ncbi:hypothetical protein FQN54_004615 [Arachnomyces sp. PD_36]|nr:hypothetical protein FQN54_004615 [Arachnomyces sp. PD_36]
MQFSTILAAAAIMASAVSAAAVAQPETGAKLSARDAAIKKLGGLEKRWDCQGCDHCYEKYLPCQLDDPFSAANWFPKDKLVDAASKGGSPPEILLKTRRADGGRFPSQVPKSISNKSSGSSILSISEGNRYTTYYPTHDCLEKACNVACEASERVVLEIDPEDSIGLPLVIPVLKDLRESGVSHREDIFKAYITSKGIAFFPNAALLKIGGSLRGGVHHGLLYIPRKLDEGSVTLARRVRPSAPVR